MGPSSKRENDQYPKDHNFSLFGTIPHHPLPQGSPLQGPSQMSLFLINFFFFLAGACGGTYTELVSGHGLRARDTKTNRKHSLFCPKMGKKAIHGQITVQQRKCLESNKTKRARVKTRTYIYALDISIVLSPCFHYTSLFVFGAISTLNWEFLHSLKNTHFSSIMCLALCWADQTLLSEF